VSITNYPRDIRNKQRTHLAPALRDETWPRCMLRRQHGQANVPSNAPFCYALMRIPRLPPATSPNTCKGRMAEKETSIQSLLNIINQKLAGLQ
jgi:hypothetical protein